MDLDHLPVDPHAYASFLLIMAGMAATPGPANLFALATGLAQGPRAGLWGVFGMNVASLVCLCRFGLRRSDAAVSVGIFDAGDSGRALSGMVGL